MRFLILIFLLVDLVFCQEEFNQQNIEEIKKLIKTGNYQESLQKLLEYEVFISSFPEIGYYLGICYFRLKDYLNAEKFFELSFNFNYNTHQLYYNLGMTKYKLKKYKETIEWLKKIENVIEFEPKSLYVILACFLKLNDKEKALETFKKLFSKYPYSVYVLKSQTLLDKLNIDYSKVLTDSDSKRVFHRFSINFNYGQDNNISYVSSQDYSSISSSHVADNFFSYYLYGSLAFKKFFGYYKYYKKSHSNYVNSDYNFSLHSLFGNIRVYRSKNFILSLGCNGNYYEYEKPYSYFLSGDVNLEILDDKDTSLEIGYSYTSNNYFEGKEYLEGGTHLIEVALKNLAKTKFIFTSSFKRKDTLSEYVASEYNYSYYIVDGTSVYINHVYTPLLRSYAYNSFDFEILISRFISENLNLNLNLSYEIFEYFPLYEHYGKIKDIYAYDVEDNLWFVYTATGWEETTQPPQLEKIYTKRKDNLFSLSAVLSLELFDNVELIFTYNYLLNESSLDAYQWTKQIYQASLKISF
ncbi:MAG: tetratricopeptide repeat protein [Endomicrobiia bacterium]